MTTDEEYRGWKVERWDEHDVSLWLAMDNAEKVFERIMGIVGTHRRITKVHLLAGPDPDGGVAGKLEITNSLQLDPASDRPIKQTLTREYASLGIDLYSLRQGRIDSLGLSCDSTNNSVESYVAGRWNMHLQSRKDGPHVKFQDGTLVSMRGRPGTFAYNDRIEIQYWNSHGVLLESVYTFEQPPIDDDTVILRGRGKI